jgi:hypothetical protein
MSHERIYEARRSDAARGCNRLTWAQRRWVISYSVWCWWYRIRRSDGPQSRLASLAEAAANVAVGFAIALAAQATLMRAYGIGTSFAQDFAITCWFTVISLARGYVVRRVFNRGAR